MLNWKQYLVSRLTKIDLVMKKLIFVFALVLALFFNGSAQPIDHAWLETSQLKVRVNADGRLFCDDEKGAFLVPKGDSMISLMRGAGIWFGGIDPGNNLLISAQTDDPVRTDFVAGLRGVPNSGKVWKVTREEIYAHWKDYLDNWIVDDPIPSIFGWPAQNNPFFALHNGFNLPDSMAKFNYSATDYPDYQPNKGDSPLLSTRFIETKWNLPSEMVCFVFCGCRRSSYSA